MNYRKILGFVFAIFVIGIGLFYPLNLQKSEGKEKLIVYDNYAYYMQDVKVTGPEVAFGVPSAAERDSITLKPANGYIVNQYIKEANYTPATSQEDLLKQYIGKEILIYDENGKEINGTLLKYDGNAYIKTGTALYIISPSYYLLPNFAANISNESSENASIIFKITSTQPTDARFSYFVNSLSWKPDYTLYWNGDNGALSLYGAITNNVNEYKNISLNLFSGQVKKLSTYQPYPYNYYITKYKKTESLSSYSAEAPDYTPIPTSEYYRFDLGNVDLHMGESKFNLLEKQINKINKSYEMPITGNENNQPIAIVLTINNSESNGLGIALPSGKVRVIDAQGFVGEDNIGETPKNEEFELVIGNAFDVIGSSKLMNQTTYEKIFCHINFEKDAFAQQFCKPAITYIEVNTYEYKATIKNKKNETVNIVLTYYPDAEWVIISENIPGEKVSQNEIKWRFMLPANAEKTLNFTIKTKQSAY